MVRPGNGASPAMVDQYITATPIWTYYTFAFNSGTNSQAMYFVGDASTTSGRVYLDDTFLGPSGGANLLLNPGFESGSADWSDPNTSVWTMDEY